MKNKINKDF